MPSTLITIMNKHLFLVRAARCIRVTRGLYSSMPGDHTALIRSRRACMGFSVDQSKYNAHHKLIRLISVKVTEAVKKSTPRFHALSIAAHALARKEGIISTGTCMPMSGSSRVSKRRPRSCILYSHQSHHDRLTELTVYQMGSWDCGEHAELLIV